LLAEYTTTREASKVDNRRERESKREEREREREVKGWIRDFPGAIA